MWKDRERENVGEREMCFERFQLIVTLEMMMCENCIEPTNWPKRIRKWRFS